MTNWINWSGGECPIKSDKTVVEIKCRDGISGLVDLRKLDWKHENKRSDIIAYRIIEDHEPMAYPRDPKTREHITAQIEALQKQLDAMPVVNRMWVKNSRIWPLSGPSTATHYFDIETINGVPHIHGIAMKEVGK
jgi:hypothetical protein